MEKIFKQVEITMLRNDSEFGIILVPAENAVIGKQINITDTLKSKITKVYNLGIELEIK